jgi:ABC-type glycerol-3-phosphate transport system substrate-binding protein
MVETEVEKETSVEKKEVVVTVEVTVEATTKPLKMWAPHDLTDEENAPSVTLRQTIDTFEATTGIQVEYEQVAWDQMATKLALQAQSGGDMPDVVETSSQHVLALINTGALMDISGLVAGTPWIKELNRHS